MKRLFTTFTLILLFTGAFAQIDGNGDNHPDPAPSVKPVRVLIPNAFTPNGDGINDEYYIPDADFSDFEFSVFDRWGNQIYFTNDSRFRWDGKVNGKPVSSGIYVYVFSATIKGDVPVKRTGTISIVR